MRIIIASDSPEAVTWAESFEGTDFEVSVRTSFAYALEDANEAEAIFLDTTVEDKLAIVWMHRFANLEKGIYVRFDEAMYTTEVYEALLAAGATGQIGGWPTYPILQHELLFRAGEVQVMHSTLGLIKLTKNRGLEIGEDEIQLTVKEADVITALIKAGETGISSNQLLEKVWGYGENIYTHTLQTHIYRLRNRIKPLLPDGYDAKKFITTISGRYTLSS